MENQVLDPSLDDALVQAKEFLLHNHYKFSCQTPVQVVHHISQRFPFLIRFQDLERNIWSNGGQFCYSVMVPPVGGIIFEGSGSSKKACKRAAAEQIIQYLVSFTDRFSTDEYTSDLSIKQCPAEPTNIDTKDDKKINDASTQTSDSVLSIDFSAPPNEVTEGFYDACKKFLKVYDKDNFPKELISVFRDIAANVENKCCEATSSTDKKSDTQLILLDKTPDNEFTLQHEKVSPTSSECSNPRPSTNKTRRDNSSELKDGPAPKDCGNVSNGVCKLGVLCVYARFQNSQKVTPADIVSIQLELRTAIDQLRGKTMIKLAGVRLHKGLFEFECHDEVTRLWVEQQVPKLMKNSLVVVDVKNQILKRPFPPQKCPMRTVGVWVRGTNKFDSKLFLQSVSAQNNELDTSSWVIRSFSKSKTGYFLLIAMNEASHKLIQPPTKIYHYCDVLNFSFEPPPPSRKVSRVEL